MYHASNQIKRKYWFEYKEVVPRGYVRLLGKLAELSDAGVEMHYFTGNHDMWVFDYLPKEIGLQIHRAPIQKEYNGKKFFLFKIMRKITFISKLTQLV